MVKRISSFLVLFHESMYNSFTVLYGSRIEFAQKPHGSPYDSLTVLSRFSRQFCDHEPCARAVAQGFEKHKSPKVNVGQYKKGHSIL